MSKPMADSHSTRISGRSPYNSSRRPRPSRHPYQHAPLSAAQSMQDLPSTAFAKAQEDSCDYSPSRRTLSSASTHLRPQRLPNQLAPPLATQSAHDLFPTASELAYTRTKAPSAPTSRELSRQVERVRCFLLLNLAFTYDVPMRCLRSPLTDDLFRNEPDDDAFKYFVHLGRCIRTAHERVRKNQISLITTDDRLMITEEVVNPAFALGITPEYLCEQLMWFADHQFEPAKRHKTVLFSLSSRKSIFGTARKWSKKESQIDLAQCLVSDDCVVSDIAPTEDLQVVLGTFIAAFSDKHCKNGMGSVTRRIYSQPQTSALLLEIAISKRVPQPRDTKDPPSQSSPLNGPRPISTIYSDEEADDEEDRSGSKPLLRKSR